MTDDRERRTSDTLGHALATGVLVGRKGWVWCEAYDMPLGAEHKAGARWVDDHPRKGVRTWVEDECDGPHTPMYSGPHRTERLRGTTAQGNQYATCVPEGISDESRRAIEAVVDAAARKMEADRE